MGRLHVGAVSVPLHLAVGDRPRQVRVLLLVVRGLLLVAVDARWASGADAPVLPAPLPLRRQQHRLSGCVAAAREHSLHAKVANDIAILVLGVGELKIRPRAGHDLARYDSQVDQLLAHDGLFAGVEGAREVLLALGKLAEEATDEEVRRLIWHDRLPADDRRHALADARLRELERLAAVEDDQSNLAPGQKLCHLVVVHLRRRDLALRVSETEPLLAARAGHIGVA
mmetsp:Transcript_9621/g.30501  ORF Transcript_9621/g.30501 Transcript_9621/m.30501 type:complete len:227 (+) Transcript_9621:281-961(+)